MGWMEDTERDVGEGFLFVVRVFMLVLFSPFWLLGKLVNRKRN